MINIKIEKCPTILFLLLVFFIVLHKGEAQNAINDSLKNYSLAELRDKFVANYTNDAKNKIYANSYIIEAKALKDSFQMAEGYYMLSLVSDNNKLNLYDSIISISQNFKEKNYPSTAYYDKAIYFFNKGKYSIALNNFLLAKKFNHGSNKVWLDYLIDSSMGSIKLRIEENEEAYAIFKKSWQYTIENDIKNKHSLLYLGGLFDLANSLRKTNRLDSARTYSRMGIIESKELKSEKYINLFTLLEGALNVKSAPNTALEKLSVSSEYFVENQDSLNSAVAYQYLGKTYLEINQSNKAIECFKAVDRFISKEVKILPELLYSFKYLKNNAKKTDNTEEELRYINRMVLFDSIARADYKNINKTIRKEYDIPLLLSSKEALIDKLENDKGKSYFALGVSLLIILIITVLFLYQIQQRKKFQKRFDQLIESEHNDKSMPKNETIFNDTVESDKILNIPEEVVDAIKKDIDKIEADLDYLKSTISTSSLSKRIGTNNSYYSRVFKVYKGTNFSQYIKELRVQYAFVRLKEDANFRKYSIKAVAQDSGFKNAESFSKSFYKKYGIYPSYFIKKLNA